jgi:hypothetical protein
MTGRNNPPPRPPTPDPTLVTHPVPRKKAFPIRSFGPGVAIDPSTIDPTVPARNEWWDNFYRAAGSVETHDENYVQEENYALLKEIRYNEAVGRREDEVIFPQPTWGFYVFLTDYDQATKDSAPLAMENWVRLIQQMQGADNASSPDPYANELFRRLRMDLVDIEQEVSASASVDRVRECFRAQIRSLDITDEEEEDIWPPPTRNMVSLVLNADLVHKLANLDFNQDLQIYEAYRVQAVDIKWQPSDAKHRGYKGVKDIPIVDLARLYQLCMDGLEDFYY